MVFGSLVELHVGLHSCLCFSLLEKLLLKASLTPPQYLAVCRATSTFSNCNPGSFSIPSGSIENGSASSIASRHLVDQSSFCSWFCWVVPRHLLDTSSILYCLSSFFSFFLSQSWQLLDTWWIDREWFCILDSFLTLGGSIEFLFLILLGCSSTPQLSMTIFSTPSSIDVSTPLDTCICRDLLLTLFKLSVWSETHFTRSLSRYFSVFFPKRSHLTPIFVPQGFFKFFQEFLHLVSF